MSERFVVAYRIFAGSLQEAEDRAKDIALEQTVEIPRDVVPAGYVEDTILGQVVDVGAESDGTFTARISYSIDSVDTGLTQLLNVIFGNSSIQKNIKVTGFTPSPEILARFPGAKFGAQGVRQLTGRRQGGLLCPVIKPMGSSSRQLAEIAFATARAGADIVKEDHGLANQPAAPFRERVEVVAEAVRRANRERQAAGDLTRALYFATLGGAGQDLRELALHARDAGADGLIVMPGLVGFGAIHSLAHDADIGLPIMAHPSFLGPYVLSPDTGFSHGMMFGTLARLAGADISVFPNVGGRFGFSTAECEEIARSCSAPGGYGAPILPSPGGGMTPERLPDMIRMYGPDCVYLLGGSLLRAGSGIGAFIAALREKLD